MKSFIALMNLVLVFVLGLTACKSDEPVRRQDTWRFSPPEIVLRANEQNVQSRLKISEASQQVLKPDAVFEFSSEAAALEIDSLCSSSEKHYEEHFKIGFRRQIELGSLIPAKILADSKNIESECSFEFVALNSHQSRHRFILPGLKISEINKYGKLQASIKLQPLSPLTEISDIKVEELDQLVVAPKTKNGIAELLCADFTSHEVFDSPDTISWMRLAYKQPVEVLTEVLKKYQQPCRVAIRDSGGLRNEMTTNFVLHYQPPKVSISTTAPPLPINLSSEPFSVSPLLTAVIKNESPIDQVFAVPTDNSFECHYRQMWSPRGGNSESDPSLSIGLGGCTVRSEISGASEIIEFGGKKFFKVLAATTAILKIDAPHLNNIYRGAVAYMFYLQRPFRLEQVIAQDDLSAALSKNDFSIYSETQLFKTLGHHIKETEVFVGTSQLASDWAELARILKVKEVPPTGD